MKSNQHGHVPYESKQKQVCNMCSLFVFNLVNIIQG